MIMRCSTGRRCAPFQVDAQCSHLQRTGMFWGLLEVHGNVQMQAGAQQVGVPHIE